MSYLHCVYASSKQALIQRLKQPLSPSASPSQASVGEHALCMVVDDINDLVRCQHTAIDALRSDNDINDGRIYYTHRPLGGHGLALLFPGQGSQYPQMGMALCEALPRLKTIFNDKEQIYSHVLGRSLKSIIEVDCDQQKHESLLSKTCFAQPALGLLGDSLQAYLSELGLQAHYFAGHSFGELVAYRAAGVIDSMTLAKLSVARGQLMHVAGTRVSGGMTAVLAPLKAVNELITKVGRGITVANVNAPRQHVVSGALDDLLVFEQCCQEESVRYKRLDTSAAFHSSLMTACQDDWIKTVNKAHFSQAQHLGVGVYANATGDVLRDDAQSYRDSLIRQLTSPVHWSNEVARLIADGARLFLEVGPSSVLDKLQRELMSDPRMVSVSCDSGKGDAKGHFLRSIAQLIAHGVTVDTRDFELDFSRTGDVHIAPITEVAPQVITENAKFNNVTTDGGRLDCVNADKATNDDLAQYYACNERVFSKVLDQQERIISQLSLDPSTSSSLVSELMHSNERLFDAFMAAQNASLQSIFQDDTLVSDTVRANPIPNASELPASGLPESMVNSDQPDPTAPVIGHPEARSKTELTSADSANQTFHWLQKAIASRTGLPAEMIEKDADFERDLGFDSVTLMELCAQFIDAFPHVSAHSDRLSAIRNVAELLEIERMALGGDRSVTPSTAKDRQTPAPSETSRTSKDKDVQQTESSSTRLRDQLVTRLAAISDQSVGDDDDFEADLGLTPFEWDALVHQLQDEGEPWRLAGAALKSKRSVSEVLALVEQFAADDAGHFDQVHRYLSQEVDYPYRSKPCRTVERVILVGAAGDQLLRAYEALRSTSLCLEMISFDETQWTLNAGMTIRFDDHERLGQMVFDLWQRENTALLFIPAGDSQLCFERGDISDWRQANTLSVTAFFHLVLALNPFVTDVRNHESSRLFGILYEIDDSLLATAAVAAAKSIAREWPSTVFRTMELRDRYSDETVAHLCRMLCVNESQFDLHIYKNRITETVAQPVKRDLRHQSALSMETAFSELAGVGERPTVLIIGGGSGIGALIGAWLARQYSCRVIAIGRTPMVSSKPYCHIDDETDLKTAIYHDLVERSEKEHQKSEGRDHSAQRVSASQLSNAFARIVKQRDVYTTAETVRLYGGAFDYYSCDVGDSDALQLTLSTIVEAHGPIHGFIHSAAVINDGLLQKKTLDGIQAVINVKSESIFHCYRALHDQPLCFSVLMSSLAAHTGNVGQSDYAAANQIFNGVAKLWNANVDYPVKALLWSAWGETGLLDSHGRDMVQRLDLDAIANEAGLASFSYELSYADKNDDWVLLSTPSMLEFTQSRQAYSDVLAQKTSAKKKEVSA